MNFQIWFILLGVVSVTFAWAESEEEPGPVHIYRVQVAEDLSSVAVQAQFAEPVRSLRARDGQVAELSGLSGCDAGRLRIRGNRISNDESLQCVSYRYPLRDQTRRGAPLTSSAVVVSAPSEWLWVPVLEDNASVRIELSLPSAAIASVPWQPLAANVFELKRSPQSSTASVVFGSFEEHQLDVAGSSLRVALIDGERRTLNTRKMLDWLSVAAGDVASVSGRFPEPDLQVIVQPAQPRDPRAGDSAVPFGYVIRDGGDAVRFFVDAGRPLEDYLEDWTATHEFAHLLLPYVRSSQKWISEGFASYYQNVLLARRGVYSEQEVWQRLVRSFASAAAVSDPPSLNQTGSRPFWDVRMLIYWSGAAIALHADTRLRLLSDGEESLDTVLARLQGCCLPSDRAWRGEELFRKLDELSPYPVFVELYERFADAPGMPPLDALYEQLGVVTGQRQIRLRDDAALASIRREIMRE